MKDPTLASLAAELASGSCSSRSLVQSCLANITDPAGEGRRAFVQVDPKAALAQADAMDALRASGAAPSIYAGIPLSVKDLFDVAGQVTRAGSIVLSAQPPAAVDALCVARLRQAGFVLIGRTNMTEFAFSGLGLNPHYGTPLNPWNRSQQHIPGGSSSGAAISITDGMAHAAIGTDTGGSCRIPAAFTGIVGYKPTARRVPAAGMIPLSPSLDSIGPIGRSVGCCAALDALLSAEAALDLQDASVAGLRLAVPQTFVLEEMDPEVADTFERALSRLSAAGARIERIAVPEFAQIPAINARGPLAAPESLAWHQSLIDTHAAGYDPRVLSRIQAGASMSAPDYITLLQARHQFIAQVERRLLNFDALLMPTVPVTPPRLSEFETDENYYRLNRLVLRNCSVINFLDGCAISIPIHEPGDAPVGLMLSCAQNQDRHLFRCAAGVEALLAH